MIYCFSLKLMVTSLAQNLQKKLKFRIPARTLRSYVIFYVELHKTNHWINETFVKI